MKLLQVNIQTSHEVEEALTEFLTTDLGAEGIEVRRLQDFKDAKLHHMGEVVDLDEITNLPEDIEVVGFFKADTATADLAKAIEAKLTELKSYDLAIGTGDITFAFVEDTDWNQAWKKFYDVVQVTHDLTIVPEWLEYSAQTPDEKLIFLDPGLSFGTGTHITTQLALLGLEKVLRPGQKVLDLGTGSGILSIASEKLGAASILATDLDEQALTASKTNLALNGSRKIKLLESNLFSAVEGKYDLILANILTEILVLMVPDLADHLADKGSVIFSGIDIDQLPKLEKLLIEYNFEIKIRMQQERWVALIVTRKEEE